MVLKRPWDYTVLVQDKQTDWRVLMMAGPHKHTHRGRNRRRTLWHAHNSHTKGLFSFLQDRALLQGWPLYHNKLIYVSILCLSLFMCFFIPSLSLLSLSLTPTYTHTPSLTGFILTPTVTFCIPSVVSSPGFPGCFLQLLCLSFSLCAVLTITLRTV